MGFYLGGGEGCYFLLAIPHTRLLYEGDFPTGICAYVRRFTVNKPRNQYSIYRPINYDVVIHKIYSINRSILIMTY